MYTDRRKKDYRWPQLLYFVALYGLWRFLVGVSERMHGGHQFLPIYSESGELEGFTHPVLVDAAESIRKRNEDKAQAKTAAH
jgi:hypothetical protein